MQDFFDSVMSDSFANQAVDAGIFYLYFKIFDRFRINIYDVRSNLTSA